MDSKKWKRYILIAAVAAIWALVIYKVIELTSPQDEYPPIHSTTNAPAADKDTVSNGYPLLLSYRDPFLGIQVEAVPATGSSEPPIKPMVRWPDVRYSGYIEHNGAMLAIIEVNGQPQHLQKGETVNGINVLLLSPDSIRLQYENERRTFKR